MFKQSKYVEPKMKPINERTEAEKEFIQIEVRREVDKFMQRYARSPDTAMAIGYAVIEAARDKMASADRRSAGLGPEEGSF